MSTMSLDNPRRQETWHAPLFPLSNLLNTQPNMTLETIAQFELALGVSVSFELKER